MRGAVLVLAAGNISFTCLTFLPALYGAVHSHSKRSTLTTATWRPPVGVPQRGVAQSRGRATARSSPRLFSPLRAGSVLMADNAHAAVPGSDRAPLPGARALGPTNPHSTLEVLIKLRRKKELPDLAGRPAKTMTRDELAATYGASEDDIDAVVHAFAKYGLTKVEANAATRSVRLSGTAEQMENA